MKFSDPERTETNRFKRHMVKAHSKPQKIEKGWHWQICLKYMTISYKEKQKRLKARIRKKRSRIVTNRRPHFHF